MTDNIKPPDPIDWSSYEDGGGGKPLPPKGEYTLEVSAVTTTAQDGTLLRSRDGYLQPVVDLKVVAPGQPHDGFLSRFNRFSTRKWPNKNASGIADYLRGFGFTGPFNTDQDYAAAMQATLGRRVQAMLDWEIYDSASGFSLKGMESFPTDKDGNKLSKIRHNNQDLYANVRVKYVVSAVKKTT